MARKVQKNESEKEFEKKLKKVEFQECDVSQSKIEYEMIDLLKQIVNQNERVIQLLTNLKDRFV